MPPTFGPVVVEGVDLWHDRAGRTEMPNQNSMTFTPPMYVQTLTFFAERRRTEKGVRTAEGSTDSRRKNAHTQTGNEELFKLPLSRLLSIVKEYQDFCIKEGKLLARVDRFQGR
jgi:hypothetical protein